MGILYRAFSVGLNKRHLFLNDSSYLNNVLDIINRDSSFDYYESLYLYEEEHYQQFQKTKSLSGIRGIKTDRLVFDFDSKNSLNKAQKDAGDLISRLLNIVNPENLAIYYSGNKGFHIVIQLLERISRIEFENIIKHYAGHLETFDERIKDEQRIFRFPLTRHPVTKRFKIPITINQLMEWQPEEIEKLAKSPDNEDFYSLMETYQAIELPKQLREISKLKTKAQKDKYQRELISAEIPDITKKPKHITAAKFALQEGFFEEGERNEACMILASTYRYLGYNKELAYNMIKATLRLRAARLNLPDYDRDELWLTIIEPVYSPTWKGGVYSEKDGLLKKIIERYNLKSDENNSDNLLINLNDVSNSFKDFAVNIDKNTIKLGIEELDKKVRLTTSMLIALLASPGAGKSSISLGILNSASKRGIKSIFFSMDMAMPQVYQRLIQKHTGLQVDSITDAYKFNDQKQITKFENILEEEYSNVRFSFRSGLTTDMIRQAIIQEQNATGILPKLIVIDYLECISSQFSDPTASKAFISVQLKDIANEFGLALILLVQPQKHAGDPSCELNTYTKIKGSGVIAEQSSVVLTLYRPGFNPKCSQDDKFATISVVKNRMGELSATDFHWDGLTGSIRSLMSEEKHDLKVLRERLETEANNKGNDGSLF